MRNIPSAPARTPGTFQLDARHRATNGDDVNLSRYIAHLERASFAAVSTFTESSGAMYVIVDGEIEVSHDEQRAVRLGRGESFGEMSLIDKRPRSATVIAVTDVTLPPISQGTFLILVQDTRTSR